MPAASGTRQGQAAQPPSRGDKTGGKDSRAKNAATSKKNGATPENNSPTPYDAGTPRSNTPEHAGGNETDPVAEQLRREEIEQLLINRDELNRRHGQSGVAPPPPLKTQTVFVRKRKPKEVDINAATKTKHVTIARRIRSGQRVVKAATAGEGATVDKTVRYEVRDGHVAPETVDPFSILGSVEDFEVELRNRGALRAATASPDRVSRLESRGRLSASGARGYDDAQDDDVGGFDAAAQEIMDTIRSFDESDRRVRKERMAGMHIYERVDVVRDEHALETYQRRVADWRRQQKRIGGAVGRDPGKLMMNQGEEFRAMLEEKALLDRAITLLEKGSADFWRTSAVVGDELTGILSTLTRSERGEHPEIECIGKPGVVHYELGMQPSSTTSHPWKDSKYLAQRRRQLRKIVDSLSPLQPDISRLEVVGLAPLLEELRKVNAARIQAAHDSSIAQSSDAPDAHSEGRSSLKAASLVGNIGPWVILESHRLTFECMSGTSETKPLVVVNTGSCAIRYSWEHVRQQCNLGPRTVEDGRQRFYFDANDGVILPGETKSIPFVFKSDRPGIFAETWRFTTSPRLADTPEVTLRGCALAHDSFGRHRAEIEWTLERRQIAIAMRELVDSIIDSVRGADEMPAPCDDAAVPESELFETRNAEYAVHASGNTLAKLRSLALRSSMRLPTRAEARLPVPPAGVWDYRLRTLHDAIAALSEDLGREEMLSELNSVVRQASFEPARPITDGAHGIGYDLLVQLADSVAETAGTLRQKLGLPEKLFNLYNATPEDELKQQPAPPADWLKKAGRRQSMANLKGAPPADQAKGGKPAPAAPAGKGAPPAQAAPAQAAPAMLQPDATPAGHEGDRPQSRVNKRTAARNPNGKKDAPPSAKAQDQPVPSAEPEKEKAVDRVVTATIYKEQLYNLVHGLVEETVDRLSILCSELRK